HDPRCPNLSAKEKARMCKKEDGGTGQSTQHRLCANQYLEIAFWPCSGRKKTADPSSRVGG
ncbi:MAG: hypothetical protein LC667_01620, partial [Thioalkalivibrio sp.]|nr:hypothetical protein [Thioalkalivibrio sp.]